MNLNEENKPLYGTVPADSGATKGSRRNLVVGLVRPRAHTNPIGPNTTPKGFGPNGFDSGMSFPGMPDSAASTPGGGYKNNGY